MAANMTGTQSQSHQSPTRRVRPARSNASIALSHAGGATAVHTAYSSSPDMADLQVDVSALSSAIDRSPGHPDVSRSYLSFSAEDPFQGDFQYCLFGSASDSFSYPNIVSSSVDSKSVTSHPSSQLGLEGQATAPWTHLSVAEGRTTALSSRVGLGDYDKPQQLATPTRQRANSSASGRESFQDSAYGTGSGKSQHDVESINEAPAEAMDHCSPICRTSLLHPDPVPARSPLQLPTDAPRAAIGKAEPSVSGQTTIMVPRRQTQKSPSLICSECNYSARTRSDLKKHKARHERQHRCHFRQCMRKSKGFATKNDLLRHLKSVHDENHRDTEYYKCLVEGCPKADKDWPRLDNFKQHLSKVHKVHERRDQDDLLQLSKQWYAERQRVSHGQQDHGAESDHVDARLASSSMTSMLPGQEGYQEKLPVPELSSDTSMTADSQMARSLSFDDQLMLEPDLFSPAMPRFSPHRLHSRNLSNPSGASNWQRQLLSLPGYTDNLTATGATMQRTQSHMEYPNYSNDFSFANSFDTAMNWQSSQGNAWSGLGSCTTMTRPSRYAAENSQIHRVKRPYTIAALDSNSLAELTAPEEARSVMSNDLGGRQEDLLLNIGGSTGNTATGTGSATSLHQPIKVILFPPDDTTQAGQKSLGKLIEDELNTFLDELNSNSEKTRTPMSQQDFVNLFRSSLRSLSATNANGGGSAVGPSTSSPSTAVHSGKRYADSEKTEFRCTVEGCNKMLPRQSDLRKHMIRHEKPYGCTWDGCNKTFGSKNDWKRHEQTQHEQQECWLCIDCHEVFYYSQDNYIRHIREAHPMYAMQDGRHNVEHVQIAANHQGHYWCGFCNQIMRNNKHGVEAVNARFDHIGAHFNKDKKTSKSWIELSGRGRRKEESIQNPSDQNLSHVGQAGSTRDEAEDIHFSSSSSPTSSTSPSSNSMSPGQQPTASIAINARRREQQVENQADLSYNPTPMPQAPGIRKQPHRRSQPRFRPADLIICCHCRTPSSLELKYATCMDPSCLHLFCDSCTRSAAAETLQE